MAPASGAKPTSPPARPHSRTLSSHRTNPCSDAAAIANADMITIGPGPLFTSLIPNMLVRGIVKAIAILRRRLYPATDDSKPMKAGSALATHPCPQSTCVEADFDYAPTIVPCLKELKVKVGKVPCHRQRSAAVEAPRDPGSETISPRAESHVIIPPAPPDPGATRRQPAIRQQVRP
jgi:hypothetical protein